MGDHRVVIIGLDGADFSLIKEFKKDIPNIWGLIEEGVLTKLESTIPYASTVAWSSFMTGKTPPEHGIIDFVYRTEQNPTEMGKPVNSTNIRGETMWKLLSDAGKRIIVFNVPCTYPPEQVNGVLIGGFPLPGDATDYTYPKDLANELRTKGWNFADVAMQAYSKKYLEEFLNDLYRRMVERTDATLYLMEKYEWDLLMVHYMETDKVQHECLNFQYRDFVESDLFSKYRGTVRDFFMEIDCQIGRILDILDDRTNVFVVSDHGFSPKRNVICLDTWLLNNGYVCVNRNITSKIRYWLFRLGITPENVFRILPGYLRTELMRTQGKRYYSRKSSFSMMQKMLSFLALFFLNKEIDIDWSKTKAYAYGSTGIATIFINLEGREVNGVVKKGKEHQRLKIRLKKDIRKIINQYSGESIFDKAYLVEELYAQRGIEKLPDVIAFDSKFESTVINNPLLFFSNKVISKNYLHPDSAGHNLYALLIASGPDIAKTRDIQAKIIDIMPTILFLIGVPIPRGLDGRILSEIFREGSDPKRRTPVYKELVVREKSEDYRMSQEDEMEIMERLRRMGYID